MKVSVVITCYNERDTIRNAVQSAIEQTVLANRIVVVDDGSTDDPMCQLHDLGVEVMRITNRGQPAARTAGALMLHDADWIIFLDGDDALAPNFIEECSKHVTEGDIIFPQILRDGHKEPEGVLYEYPSAHDIWEEFPGFGCFMVKKTLLNSTGGFHPAVAGEQDMDFILDLVSRNAIFAYCYTTYYWYRNNPKGYTRTLDPKKREAIRAEMRRHLPDPGPRKMRLPRDTADYGI